VELAELCRNYGSGKHQRGAAFGSPLVDPQ
jgi:hypothetical protein